jgi:hypothetical protein
MVGENMCGRKPPRYPAIITISSASTYAKTRRSFSYGALTLYLPLLSHWLSSASHNLASTNCAYECNQPVTKEAVSAPDTIRTIVSGAYHPKRKTANPAHTDAHQSHRMR